MFATFSTPIFQSDFTTSQHQYYPRVPLTPRKRSREPDDYFVPMESGFSPPGPLSVSSSASPVSSDGMATVHVATTSEVRPVQAPPSVPAACLFCRGKHLKCDGMNPCGRCVRENDKPCEYIASRRGYKGPRRNAAANPNKRHASDSPPLSSGASAADSCPMMIGHAHQPTSMPGATMPVVTMAFNPSIVLPDNQPSPAYAASNASGLGNMQVYRNPFVGMEAGNQMTLAATPIAHQPRFVSFADRCFDAFYYYFFGGHPFVLPKDHMQRLVKEGNTNLEALLTAMRYVGSLYLDAGPARATYLDQAIRLCFSSSTPKDGFVVQALLLVIVGLDGSCQQDRARQLLSDCERIALEINLHTRQFAAIHGRNNPVMEESWRRTWWDLYCCDGMIAGVHRKSDFPLFDVASDAALPCEEYQYISGHIPPPASLEDFEDQLFSGEDQEFSSFAYRIAAARNLGRFMRTPSNMFPEDIARIDALLANWRLHLPESKRDSLNKKCRLDEMMFQAHFMTHACTIMLHQPLSQLDSSPIQAVNSCAPQRHIPSGDSFNAHTRHTVWAAGEISKMVTQAVPMLSHSHFFTCVVTLSSSVHLAKWAMYFVMQDGGDEDDLRQQIRLNIGALKTLSEVWKAADTAYTQVRGVAQEIYREKKAQQISPAFWVGFTQEQMISSINADEGIMSEFDNMLAVVPQPGTQ